MKNQVNTSEGNVQFIDATGKMIDIHPQHVYAVFNVDTVSFVMVGIPKTSGLSILTSTAEDMLFNGEEYTFEELKTVIPEEFAEAGAQARCEIVDELPETGKTNTIYLVPKPSGETGYDEYIYIKETQSWELVGDTSIEMENYLKKTDFAVYSAATEVTINALSGAISDEASRAISAESALSDSIDALNLYIDEVSGITDTLDGDIDILEESLAQEASARTDADTVLSGAISSVTEDVAALSGDVTAHTSNTDIHVTAADKTAWADKYTKAEVDGIVSGLNDSIDAVSGAVADETARAISAETALHNEIENIDLSDYYTKAETDSAISAATSEKADADDVYNKAEIDAAFSAVNDTVSAHTANTNIHVTSADKTAWDAKQDSSKLPTYIVGNVAFRNHELLVEKYLKSNGGGFTNSTSVITINNQDIFNNSNNLSLVETSAITTSITTASTDSQVPSAKAVNGVISDLSGAVDTALLGYINDAEYVSSAKTINFLNGNTLIAQIDATDFIKDGMVDTVAISGGNLVITFNTDAGKEAIELPLTQIFDPSNYYTKSEVDAVTSGKADSADLAGYTTTAVTDALNTVVTAHTANTDVHVTTGDKATWNAKVDSGDLTAYTTTAVTSAIDGVVTAHTGNSDIHVTVADKQTWSGKQDALTAGSGITISGGVISAVESNKVVEVTQAEYDALVEGGQVDPDAFYIITDASEININNYYTKDETDAEISAATSGKADTSAVTSALSEKVNITDNDVSALTDFKVALKLGYDYTSDNISTFFLRRSVTNNGSGALAYITTTDTNYPSITINGSWNNNGITAITTTDGITSTVTNGVAQITLTGGSLVTVDATGSGGGAFIYKQYSSGQTADVVGQAVYDALEELSNIKLDYFYSNEAINGAKTFLWGGTNGKPIVFKQSKDDAKIGFSCQNSAATNNEIATFELRPNTFTVDNVSHPLLYLGHYRTTGIGNAGVQQTVIGFRQYDQPNSAAYHFLMPLPEKAKTPFSLTTSFTNFYAPLGFKNGSTIIKADETGVVDLSSEFSGLTTTAVTDALSGTVTGHTADTTVHVTSGDKTAWNGAATASTANTTALGGLKLVKISQSDYDGLTTKDSNTLYVIDD